MYYGNVEIPSRYYNVLGVITTALTFICSNLDIQEIVVSRNVLYFTRHLHYERITSHVDAFYDDSKML